MALPIQRPVGQPGAAHGLGAVDPRRRTLEQIVLKEPLYFDRQGRIALRASADSSASDAFSIVRVTSSQAATGGDWYLCDASSAALTLTLEPALAWTGKVIRVVKMDSSANAVTVDGHGSETISGSANQPLGTQYEALTLGSDGVEVLIL